jgi:hypothetical protein
MEVQKIENIPGMFWVERYHDVSHFFEKEGTRGPLCI